jgi:hypothetical protein
VLELLADLELPREVKVGVGGLLFVPWLAAKISERVSPNSDKDGSVGFNRFGTRIASSGTCLSSSMTASLALLRDIGFRRRKSRYFDTDSSDTSAQHF